MNESATRKDIEEVIGILKEFMSQTSDQFENIDQKFLAVDQQFTLVNTRLDTMDQKYDRLI